jgi:hypothetical protein
MRLEEDKDEVEREKDPLHISVLTTEYLARGLDDPDYSALEAAEDTRLGDEEENGFLLTNVTVESLGRLKTPARVFGNWRVPSMRNVIAILAEDAPAQESLLEIWGEYRVPFKVMIYSGPFVIEGTLFSDDDDLPEFYRQAFRPIEDAMITYLPDREAEPIQVKLGLVNVFHIHGFSVEER